MCRLRNLLNVADLLYDPLRIPNMVRRLGDFSDLSECGDCADAFGEDIDRDFGGNRGGCATE
jgi:hypothetical protein